MALTDWHIKDSDLGFETKKIALARIWIGICVLIRYSLTLSGTLPYMGHTLSDVWNTSPYIQMLCLLLAALCYTTGLFTWVSNLTLLCLCIIVDRYFQVSTLGTCSLFFALCITLMGNAHRHFSLDAILSRVFKIYGRLLINNRLTKSTLKKIYWIAFFQLASLHLLALTHHIQDVYWLKGVTFGTIATSSYLSYHYELFRWLESAMGHWYFVIFSYPVAIFQSIWQGGMMFLVNYRWGYWFAAGWGWLFSLGSLFFMQLGYLPFLEVAIWGLIFVRRNHILFIRDKLPAQFNWAKSSPQSTSDNHWSDSDNLFSKFVFPVISG